MDLIFELYTDVTRESFRIPIQICEVICFLFDRRLSPVVSFPYCNSGEAQEHGIHDTYDGLNEARHLVMALQNLYSD